MPYTFVLYDIFRLSHFLEYHIGSKDLDELTDIDIEVLTGYDKQTQPGVLKSKWYNIELHVPVAQSIDVSIRPAFELCGQLTSDGSILLPPIVRCKGNINISEGPLLLQFSLHDHDSGARSVWYRDDPSVEWQLHESSTLQCDDAGTIQIVTAALDHFTEFALGVTPSADAVYIKAKITKTILIAESGAPQNFKLTARTNPYAQQKLIGNLTDRTLFAVVRAADAVIEQESTRSTECGISAEGSGGGIGFNFGRLLNKSRGSRINTRPHDCTADYIVDRWQSPPSPSQPKPYRIHHEWVSEGGEGQAQVVFYSENTAASTTRNTAVGATTAPSATVAITATTATTADMTELDIWDLHNLQPGHVIIMCPTRLERKALKGTHAVHNKADWSKFVKTILEWTTAAVPPAAAT
jgi:hypothetical protein